MNVSTRTAHGAGLATLASGKVLDVFFPEPALGPRFAGDESPDLPGADTADEIRGTSIEAVEVEIDIDVPPADAIDVYLRLHLLSHRLVVPHGVNLDGVFGLLANVAWTTLGPIALDDLPGARLRARAAGLTLQVTSVDRFPRMTDYVVPDGVRIADADRVRLGAHLAPGTTIMHEGFVNYNAGTLGASMVEGRISSGVTVGDGSDVGGGASIMGTLSGGGTEVVTLGERSLLGANSGLGLPLGDDCVVEAGLYVTGGAVVTLPDGEVVKARELAGRDGLLFRRNSVSGAIEVLPRSGTWGGLNEALHAND